MRKVNKLALIISLCMALIAQVGIWHGHLPGWFSKLAHIIEPAVAQADEHLYTCSMHPFILSEEPGDCPICAMALTPVKSGGSAGGKDPAITIDPVTQQNMGIRTALATRRNLHRIISTVGLVGYEEPRQYSVNIKIEGWIERLHVSQTGASVRKGQKLLEIYSPELVAAQEEFLLALRNRDALKDSVVPVIAEGANRLVESSRKRLRYWDISDEQIGELERSGKAMKTLLIYASYDGIITQKKAYEGMYVKAGMELFQVSDISRVWIYADIYEYELPWVSVGQPARIRLPYQHEPLMGTVSMVYPYVEAKTRTVKVRIDMENPGLELRPDMYVNVRLETQHVGDVLAIPAEAVLNSGDRQTVFVALGGGKFEPRSVKLGLQGEDGYVEVLQGLHENENVVISAQFMLDSESTLREAIRKMIEPAAPEAVGAEESLDDLFEEEK